MTATEPIASRTLDQRLAEGRISLPEALRYAMLLAEALRKLHDAGRVHGDVAPANIIISGASLELLAATALAGAVTPYTAPEVVEGLPADSRSDIFSFGAVAYEMLTGRPAFPDGTAAAATPASSGSPAVDRFAAACLAKDPAARLQRMQRVMLELKLLTVAARRAEGPATLRRDQLEGTLRAEMRQIETRVGSRLDAQEQAASEAARAAAGALDALGVQLSEAGARLQAVEEQVVRAEQGYADLGEQILARVVESTGAIAERVAHAERNIEEIAQRIALAEQGLAALRRTSAAFEENAAADLHDLEQTLQAQGTAIESARTAMTQTDDLVERVVEALEMLQTSVLEQAEARAL